MSEQRYQAATTPFHRVEAPCVPGGAVGDQGIRFGTRAESVFPLFWFALPCFLRWPRRGSPTELQSPLWRPDKRAPSGLTEWSTSAEWPILFPGTSLVGSLGVVSVPASGVELRCDPVGEVSKSGGSLEPHFRGCDARSPHRFSIVVHRLPGIRRISLVSIAVTVVCTFLAVSFAYFARSTTLSRWEVSQ